MLKELQVKNFAIIDDVRIRFQKGLNVLTGETGAGKTLIIEAINLLIGERSDIDLIRDGEDRLMVQGYFDFRRSILASNFLLSEKFIENEKECDDVVITREVNRDGKNRAFINGIFTRVGNLKKLGEFFIDIHGQHDHQYLLDYSTHLDIIDRFGGERISAAKKDYSKSLEKYSIRDNELKKLEELNKVKEERLKDLNYKYEEITKLSIKENEEKILENEARVLKNYEKIYLLASDIKKIIDGENSDASSLRENLAVINRNIEELSEIDNKFKDFNHDLLSIIDTIDEINHFIGSYLADFNFSNDKLDSIQERLFRLSEIKKKYNMDLNSINEYAKKLKDEIDSYENIDAEIDKKQIEYNEAKDSMVKNALKLSELRKEMMMDLKDNISYEMADLGFKSVSFVPQHRYIEISNGIEIENKKVRFTRNGIDAIEFLISLNAGETEKPLKKIASGGEISRTMLALKSVISSIDRITTMVFDEIDAGIGGTISLVVGEKLFRISRNCQVIVITHLAQIACFSDVHYFIDKFIKNNRTGIKIRKLDLDSRVKEISRMMSGLSDSNIAVMHAEELVEKCNSIKNELIERKIKIEN
jgi:DNA repair protein RecN (Recombination protein N)